MRAGIYYNKNYLEDNLPNISILKSELKNKGVFCKTVEKFDDLTGLDVLFVFGGDGTILLVASECAERGVEIIGINYGHMGFLAEFEPEKLKEAIEIATSQNRRVEKRSMLKILCNGKTYYALNDLVLQRNTCGADFTNTVNLHAEIDGTTVDNFSSDGVIVSTPTGSTAYSLAAGGSVLSPELEAFILTPICPHSLHSRPIVFSDKSTLKISALNVKVPLVLAVDGRIAGQFESGEITVTKAEKFVKFITSGDKNFFNKLLIKLNFWSK